MKEIRASRLDNVAENMVSVLIPIVQQCVNEGVFHCTNVEYTTRYLRLELFIQFTLLCRRKTLNNISCRT